MSTSELGEAVRDSRHRPFLPPDREAATAHLDQLRRRQPWWLKIHPEHDAGPAAGGRYLLQGRDVLRVRVLDGAVEVDGEV